MTYLLTSEDIEILRDMRKATPCAAYGFEPDELAHLLDAGLIRQAENCWATTPAGVLAIAAYEETREAETRHGFLFESDADFRSRYDFARSVMLDGHQLGVRTWR